MIQGPSAGPAMVLNVLMRWPALIVVCVLGGAGYLVVDQVGLPPAMAEAIATIKAPAVVAEEISRPPPNPASAPK